jgi:serine/threonine protein kinase
LNFSIIKQKHFKNKYLLKCYDAWFEEYVDKNVEKISLYIQTELCDNSLEDVINEINGDLNFKNDGILSIIGYYIASQIFIEILEALNHLHKQNPPLIHQDLKPANILLKKCQSKGFCVKIANFGLMAIHEFLEQSHTMDEATPKYMAPEVIDKKIFDTKSDIYSLGVIFSYLFDFDTIR